MKRTTTNLTLEQHVALGNDVKKFRTRLHDLICTDMKGMPMNGPLSNSAYKTLRSLEQLQNDLDRQLWNKDLVCHTEWLEKRPRMDFGTIYYGPPEQETKTRDWDYPCPHCNSDCDPHGNGRDCTAPTCVLYGLAYEIHYALWQNHMTEDREAGLFFCGCDCPESVHDCPVMQERHAHLLATLKHFEDEECSKAEKAATKAKRPTKKATV